MFHPNPYNQFSNPNIFISPRLPYNGPIPGGLQPGKEIHINGNVPHHGDRFEVNLRGHHGIALHFNPRFDQNCVVLNTEQRGSWGGEERHPLPFHKGQHFQLVIRAEHHHYHVSVNGRHVFNYNHRMPLHDVHKLELIGHHLQVHQISFGGSHGHHQSPHGFPVPGAIPLRSGCHPGTMVQVHGKVKHHAGRFNVNLQSTGGDEPPNIGLHISVRWNDPSSSHPVIIRNSCHHGSWGAEERHVPHFPFQHGQDFQMLILAEHNEWKVAVNGQHLFSFHHRGSLHEVNHVGVSGDVKIESINAF